MVIDISSVFTKFHVRFAQKRSQERLGGLPKQLAVAEGINWAYSPSTYCHYAVQDGVHAMFAGEVRHLDS